MPSSSTSTSSCSSSSSLLATAAAAVLLLCSSLFVSPAFAADFVAPGSVELQPPPSRAQGLARSSRGGSSSSSLTAAAPSPPPSIELLSGSVRVADGDTVEITSFDPDDDGKTQTTKHKVRIWGIDAPETKQLCRDAAGEDYECGRRAAERMRAALGAEATCEVKARDQYGRAVARCFPGIRTEEELLLSGGEDGDAGLALVESGDAVAYGKFSKGFYEPTEKAAREKKVGIWAGEFEVPEDWRREQRIKTLQNVAAQRAAAVAPSPGGGGNGGAGPLAPKPSLPSQAPPSPPRSSSSPASKEGEKHKGGCDIKGNISSNNARRYHVPGTASYDSVRIDEAKGERWFCSEAEAEAAGWERAKYGGRPPQKEREKSVESAEDGGGGAAPSTDAEVEAAAKEGE